MNKAICVTVNSVDDIVEEKRHMIDELKVVGSFSYYDLPKIRKMCNSLEDGKRTGGNLSILDFSSCDIKDKFWLYGDTYRVESFNENNHLNDCLSLKKIFFKSGTFFDTTSSKWLSGCVNLEVIEISGTPKATHFDVKAFDKDGVLFAEEGINKHLLKYPANKGYEYIIPNNTTHISKYAFEDSHLTKLTMPAVPPSCTAEAFYGVDISKITLVVPKGSHSSYWMHPVFEKFRIEEKETKE